MQPDLIYGRKPIGTIGFIGKESSPIEFTRSWGHLIQFCYEYVVPPCYHLHVDDSVVSGQVGARNELVKKMQGDWLLQLDIDECFDPDLVMRMLQLFEGNKLDVLTGIYHFKSPPHNPVLFQYVDGQYRAVTDWARRDEVRLLPIGAAGGGCLLVRRSVFDRIRAAQKAMPFDMMPPYTTDDFNFFERCRLLGIQCWCAPQIEALHLQSRGYGSKDYDPAPYEPTSRRMCEVVI